MLDKIEKALLKVLGREVNACPGQEPHEIVSANAVTFVFACYLALGLWAFNVYAEDTKQKPSYGELQNLMQQQRQLAEAHNKVITQRFNSQQQIQQQLSTNQGDLIRSVAAIQASVNFLLQQQNPQAFQQVQQQATATVQDENAQVQRLVKIQANLFEALLRNPINPIESSLNDSFYMLSDITGDVSFMFAEDKDDGKVKLFIDAESYETDISWDKVELAMQKRAELDGPQAANIPVLDTDGDGGN